MSIDHLLVQSLQLLGLGMGSVFIILTLLIGIITLISRLVPEVDVTESAEPVKTTTSDTGHIAAIQAAIHQYRRTH